MSSFWFKELFIVQLDFDLKSPLGVFLIKTIIKTRFVRAFRVDSGKRKQKIIECRVSKFNYNRLVLVNIASRNPETSIESRTEFARRVFGNQSCYLLCKILCLWELLSERERFSFISNYFSFSRSGHSFAVISHSFGISVLWGLLIIQNTFDHTYCDLIRSTTFTLMVRL